jgi:hypothetical protein
MRMKNRILSNFNKFIATLKLHWCSYSHWKKMNLIGSMALRRPKHGVMAHVSREVRSRVIGHMAASEPTLAER